MIHIHFYVCHIVLFEKCQKIANMQFLIKYYTINTTQYMSLANEASVGDAKGNNSFANAAITMFVYLFLCMSTN